MLFKDIIKQEEVLKALERLEFKEPSPIQEKIIPLIQEGKDVIGHAKTGTGKTAAFTLPLLEKIDYKDKNVQVLVLAPTRELAKQVEDEIIRLSYFLNDLKTCVIYGGQSYQKQRDRLKSKPQIVVATPGRLIDLLDKKYINISNIKYLVLDEADEMLSIGFAQALDQILTFLPKDRQTLLFSATFNDKIMKLSKKYLNKPETISVVGEDKIANTIEQKYLLVNKKEQLLALEKIVLLHHQAKVMIFANTKKDVDFTVEYLQQHGIMAEAIHGDLTQKMRENVLAKFRKGIVKVLVASDVAARGLDIKGVDVVVNLDLPFEDEYYVHRVGRTGRAKSQGVAYTLLSKSSERKIKQLAKQLKTNIEKMQPISNIDIMKIRDEVILDAIEEQINNNENDYLDRIKPLMKKGYDLDSIFHGLLCMVFDQPEEDEEFKDEQRIFINLGNKDRVKKHDIAQLFGLSKEELFDIDIKEKFSFATLKVDNVESVIKQVSKKKFNKRKVNVEIAN